MKIPESKPTPSDPSAQTSLDGPVDPSRADKLPPEELKEMKDRFSSLMKSREAPARQKKETAETPPRADRQSPSQKAPLQQAPSQQAPSQQAPSQQVPSQQEPSQQAPSQKALSQQDGQPVPRAGRQAAASAGQRTPPSQDGPAPQASDKTIERDRNLRDLAPGADNTSPPPEAAVNESSVAMPTQAGNAPDAGVSAAAESRAPPEINKLANELADRILVSRPGSGGPEEVRIQLKDSVLQGSEVRISRESGELHVEFIVPPDSDASRLVQDHLGHIQQVLSERLQGEQVRTTLSDQPLQREQDDGRARQEYVAPDEDDKEDV